MSDLIVHTWDEIRHKECQDECEEGYTNFVLEPETNKLLSIICLTCGKEWPILNPSEIIWTGDKDGSGEY
jgi:hypothetical protein